jgi:hypothetical protein
MKLSELIEVIKIDSAQFEIDFEELSDVRYKKIFEKRVIPIIGKHKPYTVYQRISVTSSPYTFTTAEGIPDWISEFIPLNTLSASGTLSSFGLEAPHNIDISDIDKPMFLWRYNSPDLYVHYNGEFNVLKVFKPVIESDGAEDYDITYLKSNIEDSVIDLMTGYVLVAIGRNRRLARMTDLTIELDAESLVTEGLELIRETKESIKNSNDFHLALG